MYLTMAIKNMFSSTLRNDETGTVIESRCGITPRIILLSALRFYRRAEDASCMLGQAVSIPKKNLVRDSQALLPRQSKFIARQTPKDEHANAFHAASNVYWD